MGGGGGATMGGGGGATMRGGVTMEGWEELTIYLEVGEELPWGEGTWCLHSLEEDWELPELVMEVDQTRHLVRDSSGSG